MLAIMYPHGLDRVNWSAKIFGLVTATIWQILNMKHLQWPETEIMWIEKLVKSFQGNLFLADFYPLEPMCAAKRT